MAARSGKRRKLDIPKLIVAIAVCEFIGILGSIFTIPSISTWYSLLVKPSFSPPNWLFGPAWTTLYFLMGVSLYIVWEKGLKSRESRIAVGVFAVQFSLNFLWSVLFFGMRMPSFALVEIVILWVSIVLTIFRFHGISRGAAYLLVPYLVWVSFASILNFSVWQLNAAGQTTGINCPNNNCNMPGSSCGTVTPGYNDQCCAQRNADTAHIMCVGGWKYVPETDSCMFVCA